MGQWPKSGDSGEVEINELYSIPKRMVSTGILSSGKSATRPNTNAVKVITEMASELMNFSMYLLSPDHKDDLVRKCSTESGFQPFQRTTHTVVVLIQ